MNIAVCISGGIKYPEKSLKSLKNIFPNKNIKIFIHTWKIKDKKNYLKNTKITRDEEIILYYRYQKNEQLKNILKETSCNQLNTLTNYNCQDLLIETFDEKQIIFKKLFNDLKFISYERNDIGPISMFYSIYKCNELKIKYENHNNMKFDKVIRMRFDSDFMGKRLFVNNFMNEIVIPNGPDWGGMNDQFAMGSSISMDYYSNLYNNIESLQHVPFHAEKLLKEYMKKVKVTRINFNIAINSQNTIISKPWDIINFFTKMP